MSLSSGIDFGTEIIQKQNPYRSRMGHFFFLLKGGGGGGVTILFVFRHHNLGQKNISSSGFYI